MFFEPQVSDKIRMRIDGCHSDISIGCNENKLISEENVSGKFYPNPNGGTLKIEGFSGEVRFSIRDVQGKEVLSGQGVDDFDLDLSSILAGLYTISLENNGKTVRNKIVKR